MHHRTDVVYIYDGSFEGYLCCVFEAYEMKEEPADIITDQGQPMMFFNVKWIKTDAAKAKRVHDGLAKNISLEAQEQVWLGFLTCMPHKEMLLLQYIKLGFKHGSKIVDMLTNDIVSQVRKAVGHLLKESHLFKGFVRFSVHGKALTAVIEPKNFVMPLIMQHFCDRYPEENFLIFDQTNHVALVHRPGEATMIPMQEFAMPSNDQQEERYQQLWKQFYKTIGIESRYNPRCRMTLMPKRYWKNMLEVQEELYKSKQLEGKSPMQLGQNARE